MYMDRDEAIRLYDEDTDFPGYNLSEEQVARFWEIGAAHLEAQTAWDLRCQLVRILEQHGAAADGAMHSFLGSEDISKLLEWYEEEEWGDHDYWKNSLLIPELRYLNDNYPGELAEIWMSESRWSFWCYAHEYDSLYGEYSIDAFNAVVSFLSGYGNLAEWVDAC